MFHRIVPSTARAVLVALALSAPACAVGMADEELGESEAHLDDFTCQNMTGTRFSVDEPGEEEGSTYTIEYIRSNGWVCETGSGFSCSRSPTSAFAFPDGVYYDNCSCVAGPFSDGSSKYYCSSFGNYQPEAPPVW